jgi:hypothetical protein
MMGGLEPGGACVSVDTSVPHIARVYDYWLGGKDNFAVDRAAAEEVMVTFPDILVSVRAQRAFLGRAVHYLVAEAGVRQFLDIGTGLPSSNNTHEVAQRAAPQTRVVYVDNDRCKSGCAHARGRSGAVGRCGPAVTGGVQPMLPAAGLLIRLRPGLSRRPSSACAAARPGPPAGRYTRRSGLPWRSRAPSAAAGGAGATAR